MKLHFLDRTSAQSSSYTINRHSYPHFLKLWHYHPEVELVLILKSSGTRFIGDSIEKFSPGEIILIGKDLPHMWLNDESFFEASSIQTAEALAIHFKEDFLGVEFFEIPEMKPLSDLLEQSRQGIKFLNVSNEVVDLIQNLECLNPFDKTMSFIKILNLLTKQDYELLSSKGFINSFTRTDHRSLDRVYEYVMENFKRSIKLQDVASLAGMNPSAFSRFFTRIHRKTFTRYINEIRVGYACKLLIENKYNITSICYESGFNNISNFNRQFRLIVDKTPTEYINCHSGGEMQLGIRAK